MIDPDEKAIEATELTPEQYQKFLEELERTPTHKAPIPGSTARLAFEFMEDTGCRVNETIHVRKQDIHFASRILTVTQPKSEKRCGCSRWKNRDSYSQTKVLEYADPDCDVCHGKGKWKKPQHTTITPRLIDEIRAYCADLKDEQLLFPVSRQRLFKWAKLAGERAGINIFQMKEEKLIEGVFVHLFRALCTKRMRRDALTDPYRDELITLKLRHSLREMRDRYTKIDINYLLNWEEKTYRIQM